MLSGGFHFLRKSMRVLLYELARCFNDALARAEVFVEHNALDIRISVGERQNILNVTTAPLINSLIVIANHADFGTKIVEQLDDRFLNRVDILIFINYNVTDAISDSRSQILIVSQDVLGSFQNCRVIQVASPVEKQPVCFKSIQDARIA